MLGEQAMKSVPLQKNKKRQRLQNNLVSIVKYLNIQSFIKLLFYCSVSIQLQLNVTTFGDVLIDPIDSPEG